MGFYDARQKIFADKKDEVEEALVAIVDSFKQRWLESKIGHHPLQQLWGREDALATMELYFFGRCLIEMIKVDAKWVNQHINIIKTGTPNNRQGSIFEINCLGMLAPFFNVVPSAANQPGFDGIVSLSGTKKIRLSIKNYGISVHCQNFLFRSTEVENFIRKTIKDYGVQASLFIIDNEEGDLTANSMSYLKDGIEDVASAFNGKYTDAKNGSWNIGCAPLNIEGQVLSSMENSYQIVMLSSFHKNEKKNLYDKLDDACYNLNKHGGKEDNEFANIVFIHLPHNASLHDCIKWTYDYYGLYPDKHISGVYFYQSVIARHAENNHPFMNHFIVGAMNGNRYKDWNSENIDMKFNIPVGEFNTSHVIPKIIMGAGALRKELEIGNKYFYQRGHYYIQAKQDGNNFNVEINVDNIALGIISHAVLQFNKNGPGLLLTPKSSPDDSLLIL